MDDLFGVPDALFAELGDVDQAFQVLIQLGKSAEFGQVGDDPLDQLAFMQAFDLAGPGIGQQLADGKANALTFVVNADHLDVYFLPNFEHILGMIDMLPGDLGEVDQPIGALDVDERAEIGQAGDPPCAHIAFFQLVEQAFLEGIAGLFEGGALGKNQPAAFPINLNHPYRDRLFDHLSPALFRGAARSVHAAQHANLRSGYKTAQVTQRHQQAAFVVAADMPFVNLVRFEEFFSLLPVLLL